MIRGSLFLLTVAMACPAHAQCYAVGSLHAFGGLGGFHTLHAPGATCDATAAQQPDRQQRQPDQAQVTVRLPTSNARLNRGD